VAWAGANRAELCHKQHSYITDFGQIFVSLSLPAVRCNASIASLKKQPLVTFALSACEIYAVLGTFQQKVSLNQT